MKLAEALISMRPGPGMLAPSPEPQLGTRALLGFIAGNERYALPLSSIREILRPLPLTEVPRAAGSVMGVVSVRGTVTTLVDLRKRLNVDAPEPNPTNRILLCDQGNEVIGLFVDSVLQVYRLREDEVELAPALGGDAPAHILGIGRPGSARDEDVAGEMPAPSLNREQEILILLDPIALLKG